MNQPESSKSLFLGGAAKATAASREKYVPRMGEESALEEVLVEDVAPVRISAFVGLLVAISSFTAAVAKPMLVLPVLAIALCLFALRKHDGRTKPVGTLAARIGLVLACLFGSTGFFVHHLKSRTLGNQAVYFARQYLELAARGEESLAIELQKTKPNRQVATMQLNEAYSQDESAMEQLENFRSGAYVDVKKAGLDTEWELDRRPRVFQKYGREKVDTYWRDPSGKFNGVIQVELEWSPAYEGEEADWHVSLFQVERELIVAPSVL
ncbi:hypothetical protein LOC71_19340 [Rhodopirellula sp. JC740]|uniref:DUF4190 domain-containing protein n=1 Tax=Rhodopirellula halodulae TaxID=2894198 RepID=A0ABS8NLM5_9BACT|nr:hypothetical protein [Rhodopirellula sp. JC740]MCC9644432.1 hypothetical protein [Rhodopirellula sp. JC740]